MATINGYTRTQRKLLERLGDGLPHTCDDLFGCMIDEEGARMDVARGKSALSFHISKLRDAIAREDNGFADRLILCEFFHRKCHYRMVRCLHPRRTSTESTP